MNEPRIVITGMGVVSPLGNSVSAFWDGLLAGRSGIGPITRFDPSEYRCRIGGEIQDFDITAYLPAKEARRFDPYCHYALAAAEEAVAQAGLLNGGVAPDRAGVLVSSGIGGVSSLTEQCRILFERGPGRCSPLTVPMMIADMAAGLLSIRYNFQGPNFGLVSACASGAHSIGEAYWVIRRGDADVMLAGGAEASILPIGIAGFAAMKALSTRNDDPEHASRPFDRDRDGFVPAEGAGVLLLESLEHARRRGAHILAELIGYGCSGDAYHITAPHPEGEGAARAITMALKRAGLAPADIDYINAHGTSTPLNDKMETRAIRTAFGEHADRLAVSSTKSMTGHTLGAAGGLESAACVQALLHNTVPGTINLENPDPDCDLDYVPNAPRQMALRTAMNINLGFGGHNGVLIFRQAPAHE